MGKIPIRMKAVTYALSPFQQKIMPGLWKDLPGKIHHKVTENWHTATLLIAPLVGVHSVRLDKRLGIAPGANIRYVQYYQEKEKMHHRF